MLKLWCRIFLQFYAEHFCLSKPVFLHNFIHALQICVPQFSMVTKDDLTDEDFKDHILVPSSEDSFQTVLKHVRCWSLLPTVYSLSSISFLTVVFWKKLIIISWKY